jgi:hypothetical protein
MGETFGRADCSSSEAAALSRSAAFSINGCGHRRPRRGKCSPAWPNLGCAEGDRRSVPTPCGMGPLSTVTTLHTVRRTRSADACSCSIPFRKRSIDDLVENHSSDLIRNCAGVSGFMPCKRECLNSSWNRENRLLKSAAGDLSNDRVRRFRPMQPIRLESQRGALIIHRNEKPQRAHLALDSGGGDLEGRLCQIAWSLAIVDTRPQETSPRAGQADGLSGEPCSSACADRQFLR